MPTLGMSPGDGEPVVGISPGEPVVGTSPGGCGAGAPVLGISPPRAVADSAHASAIAITKRFIVGFLL